eukprot:2478995-Rhodomonas_salina.1
MHTSVDSVKQHLPHSGTTPDLITSSEYECNLVAPPVVSSQEPAKCWQRKCTVGAQVLLIAGT